MSLLLFLLLLLSLPPFVPPKINPFLYDHNCMYVVDISLSVLHSPSRPSSSVLVESLTINLSPTHPLISSHRIIRSSISLSIANSGGQPITCPAGPPSLLTPAHWLVSHPNCSLYSCPNISPPGPVPCDLWGIDPIAKAERKGHN